MSGITPCLTNTAAILAELTGKDADEKILKAALMDARETLKNVYRAFLSSSTTDRTVRERSVQILTCMGWVNAMYPYTPKRMTGQNAVREFCGEEQSVRTTTQEGKKRGLPKATREARQRTAKGVALLGSIDEAQRFLAELGGMEVGRETERKIALEAGRRTQESDRGGTLEVKPHAEWTPPKGSVKVRPTMVVSVDGKAFSCTKADLKGRCGKSGGAAKTRNANVICIKWFRYVNAKGQPIFEPCSGRYFVTGVGGEALGSEIYAIAEQEGILEAPRVEYITDGEAELECIYQDFFARNLPTKVKVIRVQDAMHSCGYVDMVVKALEKDEQKAKKCSQKLRKRLVNAGWNGFYKSFQRLFGEGAEKQLEGEMSKAWNYLWKRVKQMDYGKFKKNHLIIGSGMVESACKMLIGSRLMGPGMRWRFENGLRIASLRAALRSHRIIAS